MSAMPEEPMGPALVVPAGWKRATLGAPVPVVRCTYIFPDHHDRPGEQCKRWSLRGTHKCIKHGGQLPGVQEHAAAVVESARLRLMDAADEAVDWMIDLGRNATSEAVRLGAAKEVMDRAGVRGGVEVDVTVSNQQSPSDVLRDRLKKLRERTIEGEVVQSDMVAEDTVDPSAAAVDPTEEST